VHGGDFYNRHPVECRIVGTRRWAPGNTQAAVEAELRALLDPIAAASGCTIELDLRLGRDSYRIDPEHRLATALRDGYLEVTGRELPLTGLKIVADGAIFSQAGIPTVYHGPVGTGAHGDVETVEVAELVRAARVYLALLDRLWT
jgi:succinyl-diaminopimelate desuccinylase